MDFYFVNLLSNVMYKLWGEFDPACVSSVYCSSGFRVGSYLWVYDLQVCRDAGKKKGQMLLIYIEFSSYICMRNMYMYLCF